MALSENSTNTTPMEDNHPALHNDANGLVNDHSDQLAVLETTTGDINSNLGSNPGGVYGNVSSRLFAGELIRLAEGLAVVPHLADATKARPSSWKAVLWIGSVQPNNWVNNDVWLDTTP